MHGSDFGIGEAEGDEAIPLEAGGFGVGLETGEEGGEDGENANGEGARKR